MKLHNGKILGLRLREQNNAIRGRNEESRNRFVDLQSCYLTMTLFLIQNPLKPALFRSVIYCGLWDSWEGFVHPPPVGV